MPILADNVVETLASEESRYLEMIDRGELVETGVFAYHKAIPFKIFMGTDHYVGEVLAACRLLVLVKGQDVVYACYYKTAENEYFGNRVVQVEVRQSPAWPGLARAMMRHHFLRHFDAVRTDISGTHDGRRMWQKLYADYRKELYFYQGRLNIDLRTSSGDNNQDAACPDRVTHIKSLKTGVAMRDEMWHDNKLGNVVVIYMANKPLRGDQ
jgi:hypothetical protein|uniref:Uncharacterized protein n=1 Tax=Myoviridae sp. ctshb19 TaxID=2825194 RepID=A0A8S5UGQ4_9CAUD|nr:MAG TPA: hypothetical protein [Myoviridae sp. ctshb19]